VRPPKGLMHGPRWWAQRYRQDQYERALTRVQRNTPALRCAA
jgi:hypothetical protein